MSENSDPDRCVPASEMAPSLTAEGRDSAVGASEAASLMRESASPASAAVGGCDALLYEERRVQGCEAGANDHAEDSGDVGKAG